MDLITSGELRRALIKSFGKSGLAKLILQITQIKGINKFYQQHENDSAIEFSEEVIKKLNLSFEVRPEELDRIPASGPFIIVANHPYGGIDGLLLLYLLRQKRPDLKIMADSVMLRVKPIRNHIIPIESQNGGYSGPKNFSGFKKALQHLSEGNAIAVFPAGKISSFRPELKIVSDSEWHHSLLKFIKKAQVPVVPVFFQGSNKTPATIINLFHPFFKPNELPQEFFIKKNRSISIRFGNPILIKDQNQFSDIKQYGRFLRVKASTLGSKLEVKKFFGNDFKTPEAIEPVISPFSESSILEEVSRLENQYFLFQSNTYKVFCAPSTEIPTILNEIGRLREITFRAVGEGTNKSIDLDEFDLYYYHLFIWDTEKNQIVGAYRVGKGREIMLQYGKQGFYLHSLFRMDKNFLPYLIQSLELGRSFIRIEYQQKPLPLFLLWKGILYFLLKNREYRYLIGPVSISNQFSVLSKALITQFIRSNYYDEKLAQYIKPRTRFKAKLSDIDTEIILESTQSDLNKLDKFIEDIEVANFRIPVLLKKYIKLNGKIIGFNIDPKFNDALDGLIMLDLYNVPLDTVKSLSKELEDKNILERFYQNDPELLKKYGGID